MGKATAGARKVQDSLLTVRVSVMDSDPEIWRLLELRSFLTLDDVHWVLQTVFSWEDSHVHKFYIRNPFERLRPVGGEVPKSPEWFPTWFCEGDEASEEDCTLDQLLSLGSGTAFYDYDFGDNWHHRLELLSHKRAAPLAPLAWLIDGARRGPLEDSGGISGYEELLRALADSTHPEHVEDREWVEYMTGPDTAFDPALLDISEINRMLLAGPQDEEGDDDEADED